MERPKIQLRSTKERLQILPPFIRTIVQEVSIEVAKRNRKQINELVHLLNNSDDSSFKTSRIMHGALAPIEMTESGSPEEITAREEIAARCTEIRMADDLGWIPQNRRLFLRWHGSIEAIEAARDVTKLLSQEIWLQ